MAGTHYRIRRPVNQRRLNGSARPAELSAAGCGGRQRQLRRGSVCRGLYWEDRPFVEQWAVSWCESHSNVALRWPRRLHAWPRFLAPSAGSIFLLYCLSALFATVACMLLRCLVSISTVSLLCLTLSVYLTPLVRLHRLLACVIWPCYLTNSRSAPPHRSGAPLGLRAARDGPGRLLPAGPHLLLTVPLPRPTDLEHRWDYVLRETGLGGSYLQALTSH